jgi:hypothetical protein
MATRSLQPPQVVPATPLGTVLRDFSTGVERVWNVTLNAAAGGFEAYSSAHADAGQYEIPTSDAGNSPGTYTWTVPAALPALTSEEYVATTYIKAGATLADADIRPANSVWNSSFAWSGTDFPAVVVPDYTGRYTDSVAVQTWLGTINADAMADLDGDDAPDAGAYSQSIQWGEDELDLYAGGGPGEVPFTFTGGTAGQQAVAQRTIGRWATVLAGWQLDFKRPAVQGNLLATPAAAQALATLDGAKRAVLEEIKQWRAGGLLLPGLTPAAAAEDTPEAGQFQFVAIDRGNGCNGDENSSCCW